LIKIVKKANNFLISKVTINMSKILNENYISKTWDFTIWTCFIFLQENLSLPCGYTTLWHDHFGVPVLLWTYLALPILLLVHFRADLFGANFTKIISFAFSIFLIYKKFSFFFILFLFQKQSKEFLFICNKFLSTLHTKIQVQTHCYCFFLFGYSSNRWD